MIAKSRSAASPHVGRAGHHVKLVSVTNGTSATGDAADPWRGGARPKPRARMKSLASPPNLDIHDGELLPTLENRRIITRLIREWKADIVMGPRPNDYHPDTATPVCSCKTPVHGGSAVFLSRYPR